LRDVVQVRGGDEDYFVIAPLNVRGIKEFHSSKGKKKGAGWKPLPIGFEISKERKRSVARKRIKK
jgi:hypothetical protein